MFPIRGDDVVVKKMAQLIRTGAKLTGYTCPVCGTPLLLLKTGDYYCAKCDRPVVIVKSDEEEAQIKMRIGLAEVRNTVFSKIMDLNDQLRKASVNNVGEVQEITRSLLMLLETFDKLNKIINELGGRKSS